MKAVVVLWILSSALWAAGEGSAEEAQSCVACHSLRIVHSQRLSKEAWTREVDKMIGWGAPVRNRQPLIDYLAEQYGEAQPVPAPEQSGDGTRH
jgi:mono/diheme cytochrome c family protein